MQKQSVLTKTVKTNLYNVYKIKYPETICFPYFNHVTNGWSLKIIINKSIKVTCLNGNISVNLLTC